MANRVDSSVSRRRFLKMTGMSAAALPLFPYLSLGGLRVDSPMKRVFGKLDFEVTTLGLGGQASLQWTPADVDPVPIILKAFEFGVNYFDTSNAYGPSQANFGKAFRALHLVPGLAGYDEARRRSVFLTSKTGLRFARGGAGRQGIVNFSQGPRGSSAVDDLKRTVSQVFGDGQGSYPDGAYLDMILMHNVTTMGDVEALYTGYADPDPQAEEIGALAALLDYRDGTNRTGLNPREERLVRHVGFSGHHSPPVMIEMLQRDERDALDGMLVAINANDRLNFNMQHNVIPVAAAKKMGVIAMKVFADGAMYSKGAHWSNAPEHVVRTVGSPDLPSRPLVAYSVATPGVHTAIIGIGQIDADPTRCQLTQNLSSAQVLPGTLGAGDRIAVERLAESAKEGKTNYFQVAAEPLGPPREVSVSQEPRDGKRAVSLTWQTAYAGAEPLVRYEVWRDGEKVGEVAHQPQTTKRPFRYEEAPGDQGRHTYRLISVDAGGGTAASEELVVSAG